MESVMGDDKEVNVPQIDVAYVAHLARLHLDDDEIKTLQPQMEEIVGFVKKIDELDVEGVEPMSHAVAVVNVLREDKARSGIDHEAVMENAPLDLDGQFGVPRILE
jgi:aspartyl-tRNA(Asn)/glutamyl-tRNA(Gln) amidotransferase subunit C